MHNVELHIEKLVLHGFSTSDRHRIGKALKLELTRLFTEQGISHSIRKGEEISRLDGGQFNVAQNSKAEAVGSQVAQTVYKNMSAS